jgi:hypothetical protein
LARISLTGEHEVPDITDPPPSSFEAAIGSIGATEITTTHSDNIDFAKAA